jgi:hypothetical protein
MELLQCEGESENLVKKFTVLKFFNGYWLVTVINHTPYIIHGVPSSCPLAWHVSQEKYLTGKLHLPQIYSPFSSCIFTELSPAVSLQRLSRSCTFWKYFWTHKEAGTLKSCSDTYTHPHSLSLTCICVCACAHTHTFNLLTFNGKIIQNASPVLEFCATRALYIF